MTISKSVNAGKSMSAGKGSGRSGLVLWLLGLATLYQAIYQGFMWYTLHKEMVQQDECLALEGVSTGSPQCLEAQLFQSWQRAAAQGDHRKGDAGESSLDLLSAHGDSTKETSHSQAASFDADLDSNEVAAIEADVAAGNGRALAANDGEDSQRKFEELFTNVSAKINSNSSSDHWAESVKQLQSELQARFASLPSSHRKSRETAFKELDRQLDATQASNESYLTPWGQNLIDLQARLQKKYENLASTQHRRAKEHAEEFERLYNQVSESLEHRSAITPWAQDLLDTQAKLEAMERDLPSSRHKEAMSEFDKLYEKVSASLNKTSDMTPFSQSLVDLQAHLQARYEALPSTRRKHAEERKQRWAEFDRLYEEVSASLRNRSNITPWAQSLIDTQAELQKQYDNLPSTRRAAEPQKLPVGARVKALRHIRAQNADVEQGALGKAVKPYYIEWDGGFSNTIFALVRGIDFEIVEDGHLRGSDHHAKLQEEMKKLNAQVTALHEAHAAWERNFTSNVMAVGHDLCSMPERRDSPACAAFLQNREGATSAQEHWEKNFTERAEAYRRELCADPMRSDYAACSDLLGDSSSPPARKNEDEWPSLKGRSSYERRLQWRTAKEWKSTPDPRPSARALTTLTRKDLRIAGWQGMIPKVGCITVIPSGKAARFHMRYFIDNWQLQSYEGPKQLIIVYHHADEEAKELAKKYADGSHIKAVAAFGMGEFPSAGDLRFGAWSSDADVVARWEFSEFHFPEQLSMQVRAMAASARPASILKDHNQTEMGREDSLIGEKSWMREHWYPMLGGERDVLSGARAHQIVQVEI